jgi:hypothetical protein
MKVFIRYRRSDQPLAAILLYSFLIEVLPRQNVFLDTEKLKLGEAFPTRILRAISTSDFVLVMVGADWAGRSTNFPSRLFEPLDFVRKEITSAMESNKVIIPLFIDEARLDNKLIPAEISHLTEIQGFRIRSDHFKYGTRQMFIESGICSEAELLAAVGRNSELLTLSRPIVEKIPSASR